MTLAHIRSALAATATVAAVMAPQTGFAAEPPFSAANVNLVARDQEIGEFLNRFFAAAGVPVNVDPGVRGKINGQFSGSPAETWRKLTEAFNLVGYFDGSVVTVYAASQVQSRPITVPTGRAADVIANARRAGLDDAHNNSRATSSEMIMATGVPRYLDQVQQLAGAIQRPSGSPLRNAAISPTPMRAPGRAEYEPPAIEPYELRVFYLRYARADDTPLNAGGREIRVPGVGATLSRIMGDGGPVAGGVAAGYGDKVVRQSQPRLLGRGLDAVAPNPNQATPYDDEYLGLPPVAAAAPIVDAPKATGGGPRIAIDPSLNAIVVRDRPENMSAYEGLVQALDVRPQIVELEATIIDINVDKLREIGINWRLQSEGFSSLFGSDIVRRTGVPNTDILNNGAINRGLSLGGIIGSNNEFIGRIQALAEKGAARIVSRPQLVTLSNVEAVFDRTRTFYVRVAGDRQVDLFNVTAGTVLRVNPHVLNDDGKVRMRMVIGVEDGSVTNNEVDDIPVVDRSSVNTQTLINEGEGVLLGGMTVNADYDSESGIPFLKDIPVVGNLFKSQSKRRQHIERLFLITPRLVRLDDAASPASASGVNFGVERATSAPKNARPSGVQ
ncbi:type III secretion protein C [Novosphingobium chloroacetimidivorans]|uniref:Type 3 secretion system secretin n=1 Tax=Novosphingobium chloroacetimidivorans TaxID=1428314 RepID=A0A7W7NX78_9SPHN|nr:type III secretion system outer membrane ring subunit SctC [Novosphingobium chloroacetimidivorans]MBB4858847.1 type III secretion protein C [Novosphingobium chloroacetimidivorans]